MEYLEIEIIEYTDDAFPGWVKCKFIDIAGKTHYIYEKVPVVSLENINSNTLFPIKGSIRGKIIDKNNDSVCFSSLEPDNISTSDGEDTFFVSEKQIHKIM